MEHLNPVSKGKGQMVEEDFLQVAKETYTMTLPLKILEGNGEVENRVKKSKGGKSPRK